MKCKSKPHCRSCQNSYHQTDNKYKELARVWKKGNPRALLVGCNLEQPLWKTVWWFLKNSEILNRTATWPRNITFGNLCKDNKNTDSKSYTLHATLHCRFIHNSQDMRVTQAETHTQKHTHVHTHTHKYITQP